MSYGKFWAVAVGAAALSGATWAPASPVPAAPAPIAQPEQATLPERPQPVEAPPQAPLQAPAAAPAIRASAYDARELECLAKVVLHEAGNQSRRGQIAVAEVVMNRVRSPRFPNSICAVIMQRGQFFNVHAYRPYRDARWPRVQEIARLVAAGEAEEVTNGALFFRSARGTFSGRRHVATIGDHRFYR